MLFQSTLPARGATGRRRTTRRHERFQSTLPARGATFALQNRALFMQFQSTLPARGATRLSCASLFFFVDFNPRSPHGERRHQRPHQPPEDRDFNPRSPHGERRHQRPHQPPEDRDFNPRSPHGERRSVGAEVGWLVDISIHAPRTGSDSRRMIFRRSSCVFQSTLPARGATWDVTERLPITPISIHAPRTGSDCWRRFNPA